MSVWGWGSSFKVRSRFGNGMMKQQNNVWMHLARSDLKRLLTFSVRPASVTIVSTKHISLISLLGCARNGTVERKE